MGFNVAAESYDRFMGRYSRPLAPQMADLAGVRPGMRVVDVGCGPGALTEVLVERVGAEHVTAADPSPPFVEAVRQRLPGVEVVEAPAESLPFEDGTFDAALAQLVVHFMTDPVAGVREMARVTRPGGVVAACVWDLVGDRAPLSPMWRAARTLDPDVQDEALRAGGRAGHLVELFREAGLEDVEGSELEVTIEHPSFEEWWEPYPYGVGPAGRYVAGLDEEHRTALRERAREMLPDAPFSLSSVAWAARGRVRG